MTITADEGILRRLRVEAATRNLSVSRFVGELLREKFDADDRYEKAMADFFSRGPYLSPAAREDGRAWPAREEIYARRTLK
ncbi:MAG: hypothetical protein LBS70_00850 [Candidatus Accumulibacter sp.]|nr:hypothetical protein [Accumulibacter sp.]